MLEFITAIARDAGALLRDGFRQQRQLNFKSRAEILTDMDLASERLIVDRIAAQFPHHRVITEEGGGRDHESEWIWLIDPLDGTNNYAHGVPFYAVSIAVLYRGALRYGVVYDPTHDECFTASGDGPALVDGAPIAVSTIDDLSYAQFTTGFSYDRWTRPVTNLAETQAMVMRCQDVRRMGCAALDLCYVASGRSDGFWEVVLRPWDSAAGALIVQRAGGRVTTLSGEPYDPWTQGVLASNGLLHEAMLKVLSGAATAES